ncbi:hypothetical protein OGATHE_000279 [Ogataea polymorpha]|uniref:Uncharacterized protein n=1 Tax=Ogataea polymorpha TaxID=460523 RepID=A0A9P8PWN4_9ASCO|nr:hypothetical protein OGATHE_000279 [Ogataea polymorpha]
MLLSLSEYVERPIVRSSLSKWFTKFISHSLGIGDSSFKYTTPKFFVGVQLVFMINKSTKELFLRLNCFNAFLRLSLNPGGSSTDERRYPENRFNTPRSVRPKPDGYSNFCVSQIRHQSCSRVFALRSMGP